MKVKTIKAVISKKFNEWLESIEDPIVRTYVEQNTICTGGCIASMLLRENVNDFDFYFRSKDAALAVAKYYVDKFKENPSPKFASGKEVKIFAEAKDDRVRIVVKSAGIAAEGQDEAYKYFESAPDADGEAYVAKAVEVVKEEVDESKPKYRPVFLSGNAITLSQGVQVIIRFFGEPSTIHENYDFVHCTGYWTSWDKEVVTNPGMLESLLTRELRYVGSKYPVCSIIRTRKFIQRGWTITAGQFLKIIFQASRLDLTDFNVLEEQLTGVDVAYFMDVLNRLRAKAKEDGGKGIDGAYLMEILDRMF